MSWKQLFRLELKAIFTNPVVMITIFGGVIFYSFLYPLPYLNQIPVEQKITVVNLDKSKVSYDLERMVDATPQVHIVDRAFTVEQAKQQFLSEAVEGILVIPEHFFKDLLLGKSPTLAYAGDASYFLVYGTIVEGLATAGGTLAAKAKVARLVIEGQPIEAAARQYSSIDLNMKPTFNPTMGYVGYVVPAVFVFILQQTLIMGVGLMGATIRKRESGARLAVRVVLFVLIYLVLSAYYFGWSFSFYDVHRLANPIDLLFITVPFLVTTSLIGLVLGMWVPHRELVTYIVLMSSMPLLFSAGFIWPLESIPTPIVWLSNLFPSAASIQGLLMLNQMGASLDQVQHQYTLLIFQAVFWLGIVVFLLQFKKPESYGGR